MGTIRCRVNTVGLLSASVILTNCWPFSLNELTPEERAAGGAGAARSECGNGTKEGNEGCDDDGKVDGDGCSAHCEVEHGFVCTDNPSTCSTKCGDGKIAGAEKCDVGSLPSAGCSASCQVEPKFVCYGEPSACIEVIPEKEGNDTPAQANAKLVIDGNQIIHGYIKAGTTQTVVRDIFKVDLPQDRVVRFETFDENLDGSRIGCTYLDTSIRLFKYDSGMENDVLPVNDDAKDDGVGSCSALVLKLPSSPMNPTYVEVTSSSISPIGYHLEVNFPVDRGTASAQNATKSSATKLMDETTGPNVFISGTLEPKDVDYFSIIVPQGRSVRAEVIEPQLTSKGCDSLDATELSLSLYDKVKQEPLVSAKDVGHGNCPLIDGTHPLGETGQAHDPEANNLRPGLYYLAVSRNSTSSQDFNYKLVVTVR